VNPTVKVRQEGLGKLIISNYLIGNRTRGFPACNLRELLTQLRTDPLVKLAVAQIVKEILIPYRFLRIITALQANVTTSMLSQMNPFQYYPRTCSRTDTWLHPFSFSIQLGRLYKVRIHIEHKSLPNYAIVALRKLMHKPNFSYSCLFLFVFCRSKRVHEKNESMEKISVHKKLTVTRIKFYINITIAILDIIHRPFILLPFYLIPYVTRTFPYPEYFIVCLIVQFA
jgi:hypothetical protein